MSLLDFLRPRKPRTAHVAKDRLQILLAHERSSRDAPDFLPALQRDILDVIRRYVPVEEEHVAVRLDSQRDMSVLEVNVELPPPAH